LGLTLTKKIWSILSGIVLSAKGWISRAFKREGEEKVEANLENFDEKWLREAAQLEQEAGCDIGAGFDWGASLGTYVAASKSFIDHVKLMAVLQESLGNLLDQEAIEEIANIVQDKARDRVIEKWQSSESA